MSEGSNLLSLLRISIKFNGNVAKRTSLIGFVLLVLAFFSVTANDSKNGVCKTFSCGILDHSGETDETRSCIQVPESAASIPTEACKENYYCTGIYWYDPTKVLPGKQFCIKKLNPTPLGIVLPGDICKVDSECYGNNDGAKCVEGKCKSSRAEGENCAEKSFGFPDHKKCDPNFYCSGSTKLCTPTLKEGDDCSDGRSQCGSGLICIGSKNDDSYKCSVLFKGQNGEQFRTDKVNNPPFVDQQAYCSSYNYFMIETNTTNKNMHRFAECRPADRSKDQSYESLKRDYPGEECNYQTWNDPNATKNIAVDKTDMSMCGFNSKSNAWCNKRPGDDEFQSTYKKLKEIDLTKYSCHLYSNWLDCKEFNKEHKDLFVEFKKKLYEIRTGGFPRTADNDKCVRSTITAPYWEMYSKAQNDISSILTSQ